MRNPAFALFVLATSAALPAQIPCNIGSPTAPAVYLTCPCPYPGGGGSSGYGMNTINMHLGTGRIGTTAQFRFEPGSGDYTVLFVGLPSVAPQPIPAGVVACSFDGAPVSSLHIDPVTAYFAPTGASITYWLYIPASPHLVGLTIALQGYARQPGVGTIPPFFSTAVLGLTILP